MRPGSVVLGGIEIEAGDWHGMAAVKVELLLLKEVL